MGHAGEPVIVRLGHACRAARVGHGLLALEVAQAAGVSEATLSRFERGNWPNRVGDVVAVYERECGLDRDELWRRAVCGENFASRVIGRK